jgi:OOP family OmpA-OmpF porin
MQLIRNAGQALALATMLGVCATAGAQERLYGGIGVGAAKTPISQKSLGITGATASSLSSDETDAGGKIFVAYRVNPLFAVEGGYFDLGKSSARRRMTLPSAGSVAQTTRNEGWFVDLVGTMPIGASKFSLIGKVGGIASETTRNFSTGGTVTLLPGAASKYRDREANWKYGVGVQYEITKTMAARGEFELYRHLGEEGRAGETDVGLFSLNLLIKFE